MWAHLSPKERAGYAGVILVMLAGIGFVLGQRLRRPAAIDLHETRQPPVSFDHGTKDSSSSTVRSSSRELIVHVAGAVVRPGLVSLPAGSRVYDAVAAAGGPTEEANMDAVNLAAKATDGSQVYVPRRVAGGTGASGVPTDGRSKKGKTPTSVIDINSAGTSELNQLPGIGVQMAQKIVDFRSEHGTFRSVDDLLSVPGFSARKLDSIRQWLTAE